MRAPDTRTRRPVTSARASAVAAAALAAAGAVAASPSRALGQRARSPGACANTTPSDLIATTRASAVSAVVGGTPERLWVLYGDRDPRGRNVTRLLEVGGLGGNTLTVIAMHSIGDGEVAPNSLAILGDNVVAVYRRTDDRLGVFVHPMGGGADVSGSIVTPGAPVALTVTGVRNRALAAWSEAGGVVRYAWLDARGTASGAARSVSGHFSAPAATPAFGGTLLVQNSAGGDARLGVLRGRGALRVAVAPATSRLGAVGAPSTALVGRRPMALFASGDEAHLALLTGAGGRGSERSLGPAAARAETALGAMPWGAVAAWTDGPHVRVAPIRANGRPAAVSFAVSTTRGVEQARWPAVAGSGDTAIILWSAAGLRTRPSNGGTAIRMVRLTCH